MFKDPKGRIWISTVHNKLGYIEKNHFVPYRFNDKLDSINTQGIRTNWHFDQKGKLHVGINRKGYYTVSSGGKVEKILGQESGIHGIVYTFLPDGNPFIFSITQKAGRNKNLNMDLHFMEQSGEIRYLSRLKTNHPIHLPVIVKNQDGSVTLSSGQKDIVRCYFDSVVSQTSLSSNIIQLFRDNDYNLWAGTADKGVYLIKNLNCSPGEQLLDGTASAVVAQDHNGGLWVKSSGAFFYYLPRLSKKSFSKRAGQLNFDNAMRFTIGGSRVFCLNNGSDIAVFEKGSMSSLPYPQNKSIKGLGVNTEVPGIIYYDTVNSLLWAGYRGGICSWNGERWKHYRLSEKVDKEQAIIAFGVKSDGTLMFACRNALFFLSSAGKIKKIDAPSIAGNRITSLAVEPSGNVWVGTIRGVFRLDNESYHKIENPVKNIDSLNGFVRYLKSANGRIWINTGRHLLYSVHGSEVKQITYNSGEPVRILEIESSKDGDLWGRTAHQNPKIAHISIRKGEVDVELLEFDVFGDLTSEFITGTISVIDQTMFLGMKSKIYISNISELRKREPLPDVKISEFFVNNKQFQRSGFSSLSHEENAIQLKFEPISYRRNKLEFRYRLKGLDTVWQEIEHQNIQYTNLSPGEYNFQVQARVKGEEWGETDKLAFFIQTPYWQAFWFRFLVVLIFISFIGFMFYLRNRSKHRRNTLVIEKLNAEQKALRAQMNPHFIYNALSSIQELIFLDNKYEALTNIALFAKLMRKILYHSTKELITLDEEVEALDLYLKLEGLRFEGTFDYTVTICRKLRPKKQMIPPGLIQPFIENAIKHGLLNKKERGGTLSVIFNLDNDRLICKIEDNGVGRKRSTELKAKRNAEHRSFGTQSVLDRINLLNISRNNKIKLEIEDLYTYYGDPGGTRVILIIP
ncbi:sensor histidine kinase [Salibacter halophilus]|uniref:sensor histidine kinase n=1 Tax=Salibacter halophilus TaxID=1803916 RepID=UPI0014797B60|nr:histidine kinase [Salibacter halophilus]